MTDRKPGFPRFLVPTLLAAALLVPRTAPGDEKIAYLEGLAAVHRKQWRDAVILFSAAIEHQPASGGLVRHSGTWFEPYVPYFYLGLALYELERYPAALEAWRQAESEGVIFYPRSRAKLREMRRLRRELGSRLEAQRLRLEGQHARLVAARQRLSELAIIRYRGGNLDDEAGSLGRIAELLRRASAETADGALEEAARTLRTAEIRLAGVWEATAAEIEEKERQARVDEGRGIGTVEPPATGRRDERSARAADLMTPGTCSPEAVELLDAVLLETLAGTPDDEPAAPTYRLLARAHELCGRPAAAVLYRRLAERSADTGRRGEPAPAAPAAAAAGRFASLDAYLRAMALIRLGGCSEVPFELIRQARTEPVAGAGADAAGPRIEFRPHFAEALAHRNCWDFKAARASLDRSVDEEHPPRHQVDLLTDWLEQRPLGELYSGSYALVVAAADYSDATGWSDLPGAAQDAVAIEESLAGHGFRVEVLRDPTTAELEKALKSFLVRFGRREDNRLLFYYAGHGWTEEAHEVENGYIVPVDTPHPQLHGNVAFLHLISMDDFQGYARSILARHALFVFDTCFGGTVFDATQSTVEWAARTERLRELLDREVRMFLTAGDETQEVPDFSVFRRSVVSGLSGAADHNEDGIVLGHELGRFVRREVARESHTTPLWGRMALGSLGGGDIAFYGVSATRPSFTVAGDAADHTHGDGELRFDLAAWSAVRELDSLDPYRGYLEIRPRGHFAELARWILEDSEARD